MWGFVLEGTGQELTTQPHIRQSTTNTKPQEKRSHNGWQPDSLWWAYHGEQRTRGLTGSGHADQQPAWTHQGRGKTGDGFGTGTQICRRYSPVHRPAPGEDLLNFFRILSNYSFLFSFCYLQLLYIVLSFLWCFYLFLSLHLPLPDCPLSYSQRAFFTHLVPDVPTPK